MYTAARHHSEHISSLAIERHIDNTFLIALMAEAEMDDGSHSDSEESQ
jgi:hypothetical protein